MNYEQLAMDFAKIRDRQSFHEMLQAVTWGSATPEQDTYMRNVANQVRNLERAFWFAHGLRLPPPPMTRSTMREAAVRELEFLMGIWTGEPDSSEDYYSVPGVADLFNPECLTDDSEELGGFVGLAPMRAFLTAGQ